MCGVDAGVTDLPDHTRAQLAGDHGKATQLAARLVVKAAEIMGAERLMPASTRGKRMSISCAS